MYVSGFEKRDHLRLIVDFDLVVLCKNTVVCSLLHFVVLSMAAPIPEICSLKVRNMLGAYLHSLCVFAHSDTLYIVRSGPFSQIRLHIV